MASNPNNPGNRAVAGRSSMSTSYKLKNLKNKFPLVVLCSIVLQIVFLTVISLIVFIGGLTLDYFPDPSNVTTCFGSTMPSIILLTLVDLTSIWIWEMKVKRKAPQLNIEMGSHRIFRLFLLFGVIVFGVINSYECLNLYTLLLEMLIIFVLFVVESSYHVMLIIYVHELNKYMRDRRSRRVTFVQARPNNDGSAVAEATVEIDLGSV